MDRTKAGDRDLVDPVDRFLSKAGLEVTLLETPDKPLAKSPFTNGGVLLNRWDAWVGVALLARTDTTIGVEVGDEQFSRVGLPEAVPLVTEGARAGPRTALAGELAVGHPAGNTLGEKCCRRFGAALPFWVCAISSKRDTLPRTQQSSPLAQLLLVLRSPQLSLGDRRGATGGFRSRAKPSEPSAPVQKALSNHSMKCHTWRETDQVQAVAITPTAEFPQPDSRTSSPSPDTITNSLTARMSCALWHTLIEIHYEKCTSKRKYIRISQ